MPNGDPNVVRLQEHIMDVMAETEGLLVQSCGVHRTGGVFLAGDENCLDCCG